MFLGFYEEQGCLAEAGEPFQDLLLLAIYSLSTASQGHPERKLGNPIEVSISCCSLCVIKEGGKGGREESRWKMPVKGLNYVLFVYFET